MPNKTLHKLRDIIDTMHGTSVEILESKKKALQEGDEAVALQVGQGKDILSILCEFCITQLPVISTYNSPSKSQYGRFR